MSWNGSWFTGAMGTAMPARADEPAMSEFMDQIGHRHAHTDRRLA